MPWSAGSGCGVDTAFREGRVEAWDGVRSWRADGKWRAAGWSWEGRGGAGGGVWGLGELAGDVLQWGCRFRAFALLGWGCSGEWGGADEAGGFREFRSRIVGRGGLRALALEEES